MITRKSLFLRVLLGVFAFTPVLAMAFVLTAIAGVWPRTLPLGKIAICSMLTAVAFYAIAVAYFLHTVQANAQLDSSDKARWTFVLLMWFPFAAMSFWYQFIWRDRPMK